MVMMGQLMDSERKKDDDAYIIKPQDEFQQFHPNRRSPVEKGVEVPTLASLAERSHLNNRGKGKVSSSHQVQNGHDSDPKSKNGIKLERLEGVDEEHVVKTKIDKTSNGSYSDPTTIFSTVESSSSGRTSSLDSCGGDSSSGIGNSITCSSSASEPIERDALSPSSEHSDDVPENGISTTVCQALLLAEDFNGQMTAAKRFLKMVRDGIKGEGDDVRVIKSVVENPTSVSEEDSKVILKDTSVSRTGHNSKSGAGSPTMEKCPPCVQEVWAHNLLEEFAKIRRVVKQFNFIAMDTEFPGIVVRPQCSVRAGCVFPYELLKVNVDRLKIIQLGVTFMDKNGNIPPGVCTWQFNFKFCLTKDLYAPDSISLLTRCGIQFEKLAEDGIDPLTFGEYFMSSGMVTSDQVTYLTFHSGFDFGYLIKLLSNRPLPENEEYFFEVMKVYFPVVYDLKFLMKTVDLHGGLQDIANQMGQERIGIQHQAGSDSLLTGSTFFKIQKDIFKGEIDASKYCGKLYGFHVSSEDGKDEPWQEDAGELIDPTSPKSQISRLTTTIGSNLLRETIVPQTLSIAGESR